MGAITDYTQELTKLETGKEQVNIAQMSEITAHQSDILYAEWRAAGKRAQWIENQPPAYQALLKNGKRRYENQG